MNRHRLLALAAVLLLTGCSSPSPAASETASSAVATQEYFDMMEQAIDLMPLYQGTGLSGLPGKTYGQHAFSDYRQLMKNPLTTYDYVKSLERKAGEIRNSGNSLPSFHWSLLTEYAYHYDGSEDAASNADNLAEVLTAVFATEGQADGLAAALSALERIKPEVQGVLAAFLADGYAAYRKTTQALSELDSQDYDVCQAFVYCASATSDTAALEKVYAVWQKLSLASRQELLLSGQQMEKAAFRLLRTLSANSTDGLTTDGAALTLRTPMGNVLLGTTGNDAYSSPDTFLLLEPGGNDIYTGRVAAGTSLSHPISVVIDLAGNDIYTATSADGATQGSGVLGTGLLLDVAGDDTYTASRLAQGNALIGTGVLWDGSGNDRYESDVTSQASSYFGVALLADGQGDDSYEIVGYGQAYACSQGISFLIDCSGDDCYTAHPLVQEGFEEFAYDGGRFESVSGNWAQGTGAGQRNIGLSGGLAGLIDFAGNDIYIGAIWTQGTGYWSGIGFLYDDIGNDTYKSFWYSQASVAHFGIAALIDEGGEDLHSFPVLSSDGGGRGASLGFTWDRGSAMFVDIGGDDIYEPTSISCGCSWSEYDEKGEASQDMCYAFFFDIGGDDTYRAGDDMSHGWGNGGFFFDIGGVDIYPNPNRLPQRNDVCRSGSLLTNGVFWDYEPPTDGSPIGIIAFLQEQK